MAKPPKKYYSDSVWHQVNQQLEAQFRPYLSSTHVPTHAARGIIRALLDLVPISDLNREAAESSLMGYLCVDNRALEQAGKRSESGSRVIKPREESISDEQFNQLIADLKCWKLGPARVKHVLEQYSTHSIPRMRHDSNTILEILQTTPRNNRTRTEWIHAILPKLLLSLKSKHACFMGCRANTTWPPIKKGRSGEEVVDEDAVMKITGPEKGTGFTSIKNEILAYYHGLSVLTVQHYLDGVRPKTASRSSRARS